MAVLIVKTLGTEPPQTLYDRRNDVDTLMLLVTATVRCGVCVYGRSPCQRGLYHFATTDHRVFHVYLSDCDDRRY